MKQQDVMEILVFLMERYASVDTQALDIDLLTLEQTQLSDELQRAGFKPDVITSAFDWLADLVTPDEQWHEVLETSASKAMRVFSKEEATKFSLECRRFLLFLSQVGVLTPKLREMVIDQAMALAHAEINIEQLKWVMWMVLLNQPGQDAAVAWLQDYDSQEQKVVMH